MFTADDALGWVYQFWQKEKKDEVNASERKIGGADLGPGDPAVHRELHGPVPVGELARCLVGGPAPDSPLIKEWEYLRFDEDGQPAAGSFDGVARPGR